MSNPVNIMMFRRRGGFRARRFRRRVFRIAKSATMPLVAKRFDLNAVAVPADGGTDYNVPVVIGLLSCTDGGTDAELESDATNVAQCNPYSRVSSIKGFVSVYGLSSNEIVKYMLYKDEDNEGLVTNLHSQFHNSNDDQANRELRKKIIAKGMVISGTSGIATINLRRYKKKALFRNALMKENDRIELAVATNSTSARTLSGFGTVYVREN